MIKFVQKGNFNKTTNFLQKIKMNEFLKHLDSYAKEGVNALSEATPVDTGKTASSWDYYIEEKPGSISIIWTNSNVNKGVNIALILQYGHGNGRGGYIQGRDYINPAMQPIFDKIADMSWKEVTSL